MRLNHFLLLILILINTLLTSTLPAQQESAKPPLDSPQLTLMLAANAQYGNKFSKEPLPYKDSIKKIKEFVKQTNSILPDATILLGNIIKNNDELFTMMFHLCTLKMPLFCIAGNHDFDAFASNPQKTYSALMMPSPWYAQTINNIRLIFLDGNTMSLHGSSWKGGLGKKQLKWLEKELQTAQKKSQPVYLFCHFSVYPQEAPILWDAKQTIELIERYSCVKAWFSGHTPTGGYALKKGIHYISLKAMARQPQNSYAKLEIFDNKMIITGFGDEESRKLALSKRE